MRLPKVSMVCSSTSNQGRYAALLSDRNGQTTVEFAIVFVAFLSVVIGLGALWHLVDAGLLVQHALQSASHHIQSVDVGAVGDVLVY